MQGVQRRTLIEQGGGGQKQVGRSGQGEREEAACAMSQHTRRSPLVLSNSGSRVSSRGERGFRGSLCLGAGGGGPLPLPLLIGLLLTLLLLLLLHG